MGRPAAGAWGLQAPKSGVRGRSPHIIQMEDLFGGAATYLAGLGQYAPINFDNTQRVARQLFDSYGFYRSGRSLLRNFADATREDHVWRNNLHSFARIAGSYNSMARYGKRLRRVFKGGNRRSTFRRRRFGGFGKKRRPMRKTMRRRRVFGRGRVGFKFGRRFKKAVKKTVLKEIHNVNDIIRNEPFTMIYAAQNQQDRVNFYGIAAGFTALDIEGMWKVLQASSNTTASGGGYNNRVHMIGGKVKYEVRNQSGCEVIITKYTCYPRSDIPKYYADTAGALASTATPFGLDPAMLINGFGRTNTAGTQPPNWGSIGTGTAATKGPTYGVRVYDSSDWVHFFKIKGTRTRKIMPGQCWKWSIPLKARDFKDPYFDATQANTASNVQVYLHQKKMGPIYLFKIETCVASITGTNTPAFTGFVLQCMKMMRYKVSNVSSPKLITLDSNTALNTANTTETASNMPGVVTSVLG